MFINFNFILKDTILKKKLNEICDKALVKIIKEFNFKIVIGIGKFAEKSAISALKKHQILNIKVNLHFIYSALIDKI